MHGPTCIFWTNLTPFSWALQLLLRRRPRAQLPGGAAPAEVWLHRGLHPVPAGGLRLEPQDSAVAYRAAEPGSAVVSGGRRLERLDPALARAAAAGQPHPPAVRLRHQPRAPRGDGVARRVHSAKSRPVSRGAPSGPPCSKGSRRGASCSVRGCRWPAGRTWASSSSCGRGRRASGQRAAAGSRPSPAWGTARSSWRC